MPTAWRLSIMRRFIDGVPVASEDILATAKTISSKSDSKQPHRIPAILFIRRLLIKHYGLNLIIKRLLLLHN